jgi:protein-arginine kinase activator protein McsA
MLNYLLNDLFNQESSLNFPKDDDKNFNKTVEEYENGNHTVMVETWTSLDGKSSFKRTTSKLKEIPNELKLKELEQELEKAVKSEDFEKAITLRDKIKSIKKEA